MDRIEQMYQVVKQKILDLELDPSRPIDERLLVRETGESLAMMTRVLDRLAEEGILIKQRRAWSISRQATAALMREIFEVRTTLEGMCARLAAQRIGPEQVAKIEHVHHDFEQVLKQGDNVALLAVDRRFHQQLYEASGNRFLARALDDMYARVYRLFFFALDRMGSVRSNVEDHRAILDAIKAGDGPQAERLIQQHVAHFEAMVDVLL
jgi:DNA-binding GntR family transcriptional regulator